MPSADTQWKMTGGGLPRKNEVRVTVTDSNITVTGWKRVRITRSLDVATSSFELTCSGDANTMKIIAREGASISISIGSDIVLRGYIETTENVMTPADHLITISGRGKLGDLVDCSASINSVNANTRLISLCKTITSPYSISVVSDDETKADLDKLPVLPRQLISITETAWEVIEQYARYCGVIVYESELGEMVVARAGNAMGSSGFALGENIEAIVCTKSTLGTFSSYNAVLSAYSAGAHDENIPTIPAYTVNNFGINANANRFRPTYFVSGQSSTDRRFIQKRVNWMASRAYGRARRVRILTDSWRDSRHSLWRVNVNYPISADALGVPDNTILLLTEVSFLLNENGTHAELAFGPKEAYIPEPIALDVLPMDESTQTPKETAQ